MSKSLVADERQKLLPGLAAGLEAVHGRNVGQLVHLFGREM